MADLKLSVSLRNCLERIARGPAEQLKPRKDGVAFATLAGMLQERKLVRTVRHRNGTRTYVLTTDGKACLAGMRRHGIDHDS